MDLDQLFDKRMTFAGDREYGEDPAVEAGIGWVSGLRCVFVAADVALSSPAAYGKATRMLRLAEFTGAPCVYLGAMATAHLAHAGDGRDAAALDGYVKALATADVRTVALSGTTRSPDVTGDFDAVVAPSAEVASHDDYASTALALASALREFRDA